MDTTLLLEHLDWVRTLAYRLVKDQNAADDLVQEAWLAAERSGSIRPEAARGWFASVLRRKVSERYRQESSRRDRESQVAKAEGTASDARLYGRIEVEQLVVREVMALDEPYRRTILLRHFEDQSIAEIAASEGVTKSAVGSRITRGHAILRERLDHEYGGDGRGWMLALIPMAKMPKAMAASAVGVSAGLVTCAALVIAGGAGLWNPPSAATEDVELVDVQTIDAASILRTAPAEELEPVPSRERERTARKRVGRTSAAPAEVRDRTEILTLHAVDDATGKPVAGVTGWVLEAEDLTSPEIRIMLSYGNLMGTMRRIGRKVVTDRNGVASIRCTAGPATGSILTDRWLGLFDVRDGYAEPVEVRLKPNAPLFVRVVDQQGAPVSGAPVRIGGLDEHERVFPIGATDQNGLAKALSAGSYVRSFDPVEKDLRVEAGFPGAQEHYVSVALGEDYAFPTDPIQLVCPPLAEIKLDAGELTLDYQFLLVEERSAVPATKAPRPRRGNAVRLDAEGHGAIRCGLAVPLVARWAVDGKKCSMDFVSPAVGGAVLELRLVETQLSALESLEPVEGGAEQLVITGRIIGEDGEPIVETSANLKVGSWTLGRPTDHEGSFAMQRDLPTAEDFPMKSVLSVEVDGRRFFKAFEVYEEQAAGIIDLGDVFMSPMPILASGVVVDADGEPAERAHIRFSQEVEIAVGSSRQILTRWQSVLGVAAMTNTQGEFTVYTDEASVSSDERGRPTGRVRVQARRGDAKSDFTVGTTLMDVRLVLLESQPVTVSVVPEDRSLARHLSVKIERDGDDQGFYGSWKDGVATWEKLLPGIYRMEVGHMTLSEPVLVLEGLKVTSLGCSDTRLVDVVLNPLVEVTRVAVIDHLGVPAKGVSTMVYTKGTSGRAIVGQLNAKGDVLLVGRPDSPRGYRIAAAGWESDALIAREETVVQLPAPIIVRLRLTPSVKPSSSSEFLTVDLRKSDDGRASWTTASSEPEEDGWIRFAVYAPGTYQASWAMGSRTTGRSEVLAEAPPPWEIEVNASGLSAELVVPDAVLDLVNP